MISTTSTSWTRASSFRAARSIRRSPSSPMHCGWETTCSAASAEQEVKSETSKVKSKKSEAKMDSQQSGCKTGAHQFLWNFLLLTFYFCLASTALAAQPNGPLVSAVDAVGMTV